MSKVVKTNVLISCTVKIVMSKVVKTNVLISCTVTAQLICGFVFAYAKNMFSHEAAHIFVCIYLCDS